MPPEKIHVVLPGFNPEQFGPVQPGPPPDGEPYLLYIGNVMPHKNLVRLVEAFAMVTRRLPARLVLRGWGRDGQVKLLGERIRALGLERQIDWQSYAPDDELLTRYRGAQALALPSLHEGFGLTALEAMACGTPVVASGVSSIPEVVGDAAVLIDPLDPESIARGLCRILTDDRLCKDLRERGLERAGHFSWEATARSVQHVAARAVAAQ